MIGDIMRVRPPVYEPITSGGENRVYLSGSTLNIRRQLIAAGALLRDSRYDFLFRPGPWCPNPSQHDLDAQPSEDLDTLLEAWLGNETPITILDLSGVPEAVLTDLIGVILRLLFDSLFWARNLPEGGRSRPLLVVLEEAHTYLGVGYEGPAASAAKRVVKEGRKYGFGAMVVSQRPSEIDSTILSQCGTMIAMRLSNSTDRSHVTGTTSDNLDGLFGMLPALRTGEAIIVGEAVTLPIRASIDPPDIDRRPDSHDPKIFDSNGDSGWNAKKRMEDYGKVVEQWRAEDPRLSSSPGGTRWTEPQ